MCCIVDLLHCIYRANTYFCPWILCSNCTPAYQTPCADITCFSCHKITTPQCSPSGWMLLTNADQFCIVGEWILLCYSDCLHQMSFIHTPYAHIHVQGKHSGMALWCFRTRSLPFEYFNNINIKHWNYKILNYFFLKQHFHLISPLLCKHLLYSMLQQGKSDLM